MPPREELLWQIGRAANLGVPVAVMWHALVAGAVLALFAGWRPSRRLAAAILVLLITSAAAVAWAFGIDFNALVLALFALLIGVLGLRAPADAPIARAHGWRFGAGVALAALGFVYPLFLTGPAISYLAAAPLGVLPCPTLLFCIGAALAAEGALDKPAALVLAIAGIFYGATGAGRLGVALDWALLAGAAALAASALSAQAPRLRPRPG